MSSMKMNSCLFEPSPPRAAAPCWALCALLFALTPGCQREREPSQALRLSTEQRKQYKLLLSLPAVVHLRTAFGNYLAGHLDGISPKAASASRGGRAGLAVYKDYLHGRFVVLSADGWLIGGTLVRIMFVNKPDRIFTAGVSEQPELRIFMPDPAFSSDDVERVKQNLKLVFADTSLSL